MKWCFFCCMRIAFITMHCVRDMEMLFSKYILRKFLHFSIIRKLVFIYYSEDRIGRKRIDVIIRKFVLSLPTSDLGFLRLLIIIYLLSQGLPYLYVPIVQLINTILDSIYILDLCFSLSRWNRGMSVRETEH